MRPIACLALTIPVILTACNESTPAPNPAAQATKTTTPPAPKKPTKPTVTASTLPGTAASGDGHELAPGMLAWDLAHGQGAQLPITDATATFKMRAWTSNGTQWFGQADEWDELVLPTGDAGAFPGWADAVADMRSGDVRKVWISAEGRDASTWPAPADSSGLPDLIMDIELIDIAKKNNPDTYPGVPLGTTAAQGHSNGLRWYDLTTGDGQVAASGDDILMMCDIWKFDGTPWQTTGGSPVLVTIDKSLMPGLREGLLGMTPGSTRKLIVPPALGAGFMPLSDLAPGETLVMDVTFVERPTTTATAEPAPN